MKEVDFYEIAKALTEKLGFDIDEVLISQDELEAKKEEEEKRDNERKKETANAVKYWINTHKRNFKHSDTRSGTDNDAIYIWKICNTDVYKIGITSKRLGKRRIEDVARKHEVDYKILALAEVKDAMRLETVLHKIYTTPQNLITEGDGMTEFRTLTKAEVIEALDHIKQHMISGELNYPEY